MRLPVGTDIRVFLQFDAPATRMTQGPSLLESSRAYEIDWHGRRVGFPDLAEGVVHGYGWTAYKWHW